jgi:hypothetical protein
VEVLRCACAGCERLNYIDELLHPVDVVISPKLGIISSSSSSRRPRRQDGRIVCKSHRIEMEVALISLPAMLWQTRALETLFSHQSHTKVLREGTRFLGNELIIEHAIEVLPRRAQKPVE